MVVVVVSGVLVGGSIVVSLNDLRPSLSATWHSTHTIFSHITVTPAPVTATATATTATNSTSD